jgi:acyl-CoA hydrolase
VDQLEHEVDVLITEHGIADLRALEPYERARRIIEECADPKFREKLKAYVEKARLHPGRIPVLPGDEFDIATLQLLEKKLSLLERFPEISAPLQRGLGISAMGSQSIHRWELRTKSDPVIMPK